MQIYIKLFLLTVLLGACSPAMKLKRAERLIRRAVEQGAVADTLTTHKRESVELLPLSGAFELNYSPRIEIVRKDCEELIRKPTGRALQRLQKTVCPPVNIDSTYFLQLTAQGEHYSLPLRLQISNKGGSFSYKISSGALKVPIVTQENKYKFEAGLTHWQVIWRCVIVGAVCLIAGFVAGKLIGWWPF